MKIKVILRSLLFVCHAVTTASAQSTCSASNAYVVTDQSSGQPRVDPTGCNGDAQCLAFANQASGYLSGSSLSAIGSLGARSLAHRQNADLTCSATENCFSYHNFLLCIDLNSGGFHDNTGGKGNLLTGEYSKAATSGGGTETATRTGSAISTTATGSQVAAAGGSAASKDGLPLGAVLTAVLSFLLVAVWGSMNCYEMKSD
jgi:hypothetical protein